MYFLRGPKRGFYPSTLRVSKSWLGKFLNIYIVFFKYLFWFFLNFELGDDELCSKICTYLSFMYETPNHDNALL